MKGLTSTNGYASYPRDKRSRKEHNSSFTGRSLQSGLPRSKDDTSPPPSICGTTPTSSPDSNLSRAFYVTRLRSPNHAIAYIENLHFGDCATVRLQRGAMNEDVEEIENFEVQPLSTRREMPSPTTTLPRICKEGRELPANETLRVNLELANCVSKSKSLVSNLEWTIRSPMDRTGNYDGPTLHGVLPHGIGTLHFDDGDIYVGPFSYGEIDGVGGTYQSTDGAYYDGDFRFGMKHGNGEEIFPSGIRYIGRHQYGHAHGFGVQYNPDGSIFYAGKWECGQPCIRKSKIVLPTKQLLPINEIKNDENNHSEDSESSLSLDDDFATELQQCLSGGAHSTIPKVIRKRNSDVPLSGKRIFEEASKWQDAISFKNFKDNDCIACDVPGMRDDSDSGSDDDCDRHRRSVYELG